MTEEEKQDTCGGSASTAYCCKVDSIVTLDDRGQMVLPKDIREKAGFKAGEKIALLVSEKDGKVCCISLIPANDLSNMAKKLLGPLFKGLE